MKCTQISFVHTHLGVLTSSEFSEASTDWQNRYCLSCSECPSWIKITRQDLQTTMQIQTATTQYSTLLENTEVWHNQIGERTSSVSPQTECLSMYPDDCAKGLKRNEVPWWWVLPLPWHRGSVNEPRAPPPVSSGGTRTTGSSSAGPARTQDEQTSPGVEQKC